MHPRVAGAKFYGRRPTPAFAKRRRRFDARAALDDVRLSSPRVARYILEKYYGVRVARMMVACFHPDVGEAPFIDEVPSLPTEVESMMLEQRQRHLTVGILSEPGHVGISLQRIVDAQIQACFRLHALRVGL